MRDLIGDLRAEQEDLDRLLSGLDERSWDIVTPAEPWTVRDTVSHLAFFDDRQREAILDPETFAADINVGIKDGIDAYVALGINRGRALTPAEVLDWWRSARTAALRAFENVGPEDRLPWFGPPMKGRSAVTARLMETWAHGHDVAEAIGVRRPATDRLFAIAELGVKTFSWSYANRGLEIPAERVRVTLRSPGGTTRVWNEAMESSVTGGVEEFCLVVAQRKNFLDTTLVVEGEVARSWMEIAQVFAGPPGPGRLPMAEYTDL